MHNIASISSLHFNPVLISAVIDGSEDFEDEQKETDTLNHTDLSIPHTVNPLLGPKCVKQLMFLRLPEIGPWVWETTGT